eukprot:3552172-Prymnesium_polylepis.1
MRKPTLLCALLFAFAAAEEAESAPEVAAEGAVEGVEGAEEAEEVYTPPETVEGAQFYESFVDDWESRWVVSKDAEFTGKWKHEVHPPPNPGPLVTRLSRAALCASASDLCPRRAQGGQGPGGG